MWDKALHYCREAGARAFARSAHVEALSRVEQALDALAHLGDRPGRAALERELITERAAALRALRGYAATEVEEVYQKTRELFRTVGDGAERFAVDWQQMQFFLVRGDLDGAASLAARLLDHAERRQERPLLLDAHLATGMTRFHQGEFARARQHLEHGVALYRQELDGPHLVTHGQDPGVFCLSYLAYTLWFLGYPDQAAARAQLAVDIARGRAHALSEVSALTFAARVWQCRRDLDRVVVAAREVIRASRQHGFAYYEAQGLIHEGWALAMADGDQGACSQVFEGYTALERTGTVLGLRGVLVQLADAYQRVGRRDEARWAVARAQHQGPGIGTRCWDAEMARLRAELLARGPDGDLVAASDWYRTALDTARRQAARSLELRAALSYARSFGAAGAEGDAREALAAAVKTFTEGEDTVELREARARLRE